MGLDMIHYKFRKGNFDMRKCITYTMSTILFMTILLGKTSVYSGQLYNENLLKGIKSFYLIFLVEEVGELTRANVKNDVVSKLTESNIKIDRSSNDILEVYVDTFYNSKKPEVIAFNFRISVKRHATLTYKKYYVAATVWEETYSGMSHVSNIRRIRDDIKGVVDVFLIDYMKANPKKR